MVVVSRLRAPTRVVCALASGLLITSVSLTGTAHAATPAVSRPAVTAPNPLVASGEAGVCSDCSPPLLYRNGVVTGTATQTGEVTFTPIYWQPAGVAAYNFNTADPTYMSLINRFITDVAADSGTTTNVFANNTQYTQTVNGVTTNIKYLIHAGTPMIDPDAFPTTGQCALQVDTYQGTPTAPVNYTACLTSTQIQAELRSYLAANSLPEDLGHQYAVFFPPGVQTFETGSYSGVTYVGIHQSFNVTPGKGVIYYDDEPYQDNFYDGGTPNNDVTADTEIDVLSHEFNESITDPSGKGWWDSSGNEIGDECSDAYGPPLGMVPVAGFVPQPYNQVINGDKYYVQREFSNAAYAALGVGKGCVQTLFTPKAPQVRDAAAGPEMVGLDASPADLPADGTSTSTVTVTVLDANGEPVVGDNIHMSVQADYDTIGAGGHTVGGGSGTAGICGTLSGDNTAAQEGVTNAHGQVTVTYTASADTSECYVLATDINQGTTNQTVIYQGADSADAPTVGQTLPATVTAGGPPVTFTATATNPSATDIPDARFDLAITGDASGAIGVDAGQLTLAYRDDATNGQFVDVPLVGTTVDDGEIGGFVIPDTAQKLAAGATRTATFQLSLAHGAPLSTTTGNPLSVQTSLDVFNPADGAQSNLDYTTGTLPVAANSGDSITYKGKVTTTAAPTETTIGSAVLVADTCVFVSDGSPCTFTGTETLTLTGGTLTGTVSSNKDTHDGARLFTFTENLTTTASGTTVTGAGSGSGQTVYLDDGNVSPDNVTDSFTETLTRRADIANDQGTLTLTPAS